MKKKDTATHKLSPEQASDVSPRRAKLIKKRVRTSTKALTEDVITPNRTSWGDTAGCQDIPTPHFEERIAFRAYERFLDRGGHHGHDLTDWLAAEREVMSDSQCSP